MCLVLGRQSRNLGVQNLASNRLTADQLPKVYGHEIGHVVDLLAGEIPVKWIERRPAWEHLTGMRDREPEGSTVHPAVPCPPNWLWAQEHAPNLPVGGSRLIRTGESTNAVDGNYGMAEMGIRDLGLMA